LILGLLLDQITKGFFAGCVLGDSQVDEIQSAWRSIERQSKKITGSSSVDPNRRKKCWKLLRSHVIEAAYLTSIQACF